MGNKMANSGGKRVKKGGKSPVIAITVCVCLAAVLIGGYLGLCTWAGWHILPNSEAAGVELGGLSRTQAAERLEQAAGDWQGQSVALTFNGKSVPCELDKANLSFDTDAVLDQMTAGKRPSRCGARFG